MKEFIKIYGTLIIAIFGVLQYWVMALWKAITKKGTIKLYETGYIEIGYSTIGPTIGLTGTLRTLDKDLFINSIDLLLIREKDKAQHIFNWIAFRPIKIDFASSQQFSMEIPSGFLILQNAPHRFNIIFNDMDLSEEIKSFLNTYNNEWYKITEELNKLKPAEKHLELIDTFKKSNISVDTYSDLIRVFYWEQGYYNLTVNIRTSKPDKVFKYCYNFSITDIDSKNLKINVVTMINEPISVFLDKKNFPYNFSYVLYKKIIN